MILSSNLGYPRIGKNRELKQALEAYWKKNLPLEDLLATGDTIQVNAWKLQREAGIDLIPGNDFSYYDHVLDTALMVGVIPERFTNLKFSNPQDLAFAMARGFQLPGEKAIAAMEMTKWFNTNYHYIVPEVNEDTNFKLDPSKVLSALALAAAHGQTIKPVILGPVSFLLLSKSISPGFEPLERLMDLLPLYRDLFSILAENGAEYLQLDEPFLCLDLSEKSAEAYKAFFSAFSLNLPRPNVILTTYFADPTPNLHLLNASPFEGLHLDFLNIADADDLLGRLSSPKILSLGLVDGRNVWRQDLDKSLALARKAAEIVKPDALVLAPSCSLIHVPQDVEMEKNLDPQVKLRLSFADQKLQEITALKAALEGGHAHEAIFSANRAVLAVRQANETQNRPSIEQYSPPTQISLSRKSPFEKRKRLQQAAFNLPVLPTTTIGSFPQTGEVRKTRAQFTKGGLTREQYDDFLREKIREVIAIQEEIGLDVLVHGEFERNDMVQYFAEQMDGFAFTEHGWVQSFGSRYVRPPVIHGVVQRPQAMTVAWAKFAQAQTSKPVKGMLTGPVTILQWSFVRDDQPRAVTCRQIALAIRKEVQDLEEAGIKIIQIDEPALREGLPLHRSDWQEYLDWAVECFRLASGGAADDTQIHTHMCYAEFNDILPAIAAMDADVLSMEASRSKMELLDAFERFDYPNDIGPGVYDIHSPNVPTAEAIEGLLQRAMDVIPAERLWVNPDCGLKTRAWEQVIPSLNAMVSATRKVREELS